MRALADALRSANLAPRLEGEERLWVDTESERLLLKPVAPAHLDERAFLQRAPFDGLVVHAGGRVFHFEGQAFEVITLRPELRPIEDPEAALGLRELYTHADRITMLTPPLDIDALVDGHHAHWDVDKPHAQPDHGRPPIDRAVQAFRALAEPLRPASPERFRRGLFHEDLQVGNLMLAPSGALHVIDPDPVWHAPAVLNLAHFLVMEVFAKQHRDRLAPLRAAMLEVLEEETPRDFDFFVLLAIFRALVRRAFHADYHHAGWCDDLVWYLDTFGRQQYLEVIEA